MLEIRERNQWKFPSQIKSETEGKKSQQGFKRWKETKTKMQNKGNDKTKCFWAFEFYKKKTSKRPRKLSNYQAHQSPNFKKNFNKNAQIL